MSDRNIAGLPRGMRIGKYEIAGLMGAGGMGAVYEALHVDLKKRVAIKVLHPEFARKAVARQRFLREGEAASRIRHPHVVDITDVGIEGDMPYMVMEYLEGADLKTHLIQYAPLPVEETIDLMLPILAAVAAGHDEGVIHRDLKPHNIFVARLRSGEFHPKVLDFGVSKLTDMGPDAASLTGTSVVMGTIAYMSPEQAKGAKFVDPRTDQYALGLIFYECLTGVRPHRGDSTLAILRSIGDGHIEPPRIHKHDLPEVIEQAILKSLSTKPDDRFTSLYAFGRTLLPFASDRGKSLWTRAFDREPSSAGMTASFVSGEDGVEEPPPSRAPSAPRPSRPQPRVTPVPFAPSVRVSNVALDATAAPDPTASPKTALARPSARVPAPAAPVGDAPAGDSTLGRSAAELRAPAPGPRRGNTGAIIGGVALAAVAAGAVLAFRPSAPSPPGTSVSAAGAVPAVAPAPAAAAPRPAPALPTPRLLQVSIAAEPDTAEITLDDEVVGRGKFTRDLPVDGKSHTLRVSAPGFEPWTFGFSEDAPPAKVALAPVKRRTSARTSEPKEPPPAATPKVGANQAPIIKE